MIEVLKWASKGEAAVARVLVSELLSKGYKIAVHDGGSWATYITNDEQKILESLCSTGEDTIKIYEGDDNQYRGFFFLVWGNADDGLELLADWSDNEFTNAVVKNIGYMEV